MKQLTYLITKTYKIGSSLYKVVVVLVVVGQNIFRLIGIIL
jgi:hypothetical protein